jgi:hypothetical protein
MSYEATLKLAKILLNISEFVILYRPKLLQVSHLKFST